jgi:hypothetical protein
MNPLFDTALAAWGWLDEKIIISLPIIVFLFVFYSDRSRKTDDSTQYLKLIAASVSGIFVLLLSLASKN